MPSGKLAAKFAVRECQQALVFVHHLPQLEMPERRRDRLGRIVLPGLRLERDNALSLPDDGDICKAVEAASRTQIVDGQPDRLGWCCDAELARDADDGRCLQECAGHAAMDGGENRIADDLARERHVQHAARGGADAEAANERTVGEWARGVFGRVEDRHLIRLPVPQHVGAVGADHEAGCGGGDRVLLGLLICGRANEGDGARDVIADRMRLDVEAGFGRLLVIDAQIEGGDRPGTVERQLHGHAAAFIEHGGDHAAVDHAGFDVADEDGLVGQAGPGLAALGAIDAKSAGAAIKRPVFCDRFRELLEGQRLPIIGRDFRHGSNLACPRDEVCRSAHET